MSPLTKAAFCIAILAGFAAAAEPDRSYRPDLSQDKFLESMEYRTFLYFWEQAGPKTGIIRDRAPLNGSDPHASEKQVGSAAATGFGLTALSIAAERHWVAPVRARERVLLTLRFLAYNAPTVHGFYYHWMDPDTGERRWNSEVSSIDTALLLAGVLTAGQAFPNDAEIPKLAAFIYDRVDFAWMLNGDPYLLSHGWTPEHGFLPYRWNSYSELMILYMLAIGSPTHAIPPKAWYAWGRPSITYRGFTYVTGGPLFIHQYSHAWIDFRNLKEKSPKAVDWFENSVSAIRAQKAFCKQLSSKFPSYDNGVWGITASDSMNGYRAWGEVPKTSALDGTVVPSAVGGSLMFVPDLAMPAIFQMYKEYGSRIYGRYGFTDAFDPAKNWVGQDVIGIDEGIILLSSENLRTGMVWHWFMQTSAAIQAIQRIGFVVEPPKRGILNRILVWRDKNKPEPAWVADLTRKGLHGGLASLAR